MESLLTAECGTWSFILDPCRNRRELVVDPAASIPFSPNSEIMFGSAGMGPAWRVISEALDRTAHEERFYSLGRHSDDNPKARHDSAPPFQVFVRPVTERRGNNPASRTLGL